MQNDYTHKLKDLVNHGDVPGLHRFLDDHRTMLSAAFTTLAKKGKTDVITGLASKYKVINVANIFLTALKHGHYRTAFAISEIRIGVVTLDQHVSQAMSYRKMVDLKYLLWMVKHRHREILNPELAQQIVMNHLHDVCHDYVFDYDHMNQLADYAKINPKHLDAYFYAVSVSPKDIIHPYVAIKIAWILDRGCGDVSRINVSSPVVANAAREIVKHLRNDQIKQQLVAKLVAYELEKTSLY